MGFFMLRSALFAILIFSITACGDTVHQLNLQPGYTAGGYAVKSVTIQPINPKMSADPEYQEAARRILELQRWEQIGAGQQPEVSLLVTITDVSLAINTGRAWLAGDQFRIAANIELREVATGKLVAQDSLLSMTDDKTGQFGLLGAAMAAGRSDDYNESEKTALIQRFVGDVTQYITTGRLQWIRNKLL